MSLSLIVTVSVLEPSSVAPLVSADSVSVNVSALFDARVVETVIDDVLVAVVAGAPFSVPELAPGRVVRAFGRGAGRSSRIARLTSPASPPTFAARAR